MSAPESDQEMPKEDAEGRPRSDGRIVFVAVAFASLWCVVYALKFGTFLISSDPEDWGQFGDYVGGIANPTFALATALLLVATLRESRRSTAKALAIAATDLGLVRESMEEGKRQFDRGEALTLHTRRLEATLAAWERAIDAEFKGIIGSQRTGIPTDSTNLSSSLSIREVFRNDQDGTRVGNLAELHYEKLRGNWRDQFLDCVNIIIELDEYCQLIDRIDTTRLVSNFYRRRVTQPVRFLLAARQLSPDLAARLNAPRFLGDIGHTVR